MGQGNRLPSAKKPTIGNQGSAQSGALSSLRGKTSKLKSVVGKSSGKVRPKQRQGSYASS